MKKKIKEKIFLSTPPSPENAFYSEWALQFPKESLLVLNDSLNRLFTFSVALFSIMFAINDKMEGFPSSLYVTTLLILFLTMTLSFISIMPIESKVSKHKPLDIKEAIAKIYARKRFYLILVYLLMSLSIILILLGVMQKFKVFGF